MLNCDFKLDKIKDDMVINMIWFQHDVLLHRKLMVIAGHRNQIALNRWLTGPYEDFKLTKSDNLILNDSFRIPDEYQYLSPVTTARAPPRKKVFRKKIQRRVSSTVRPTSTRVPNTTTPQPTAKPFEKVSQPVRTFRPIVNYDYYDDSEEKVVHKYATGAKVVLHDEGTSQIRWWTFSFCFWNWINH